MSNEKTQDDKAAWLVDAVATASQHPALNPSSPEYDSVLAGAIFNNGRTLASSGEPYVPEEVPAAFVDWLVHEMPPGTTIGDPGWWAPKIWGRVQYALASAPAVPNIPESVVDEIVGEFEWMAEDENGLDAGHTPADWERLMLKDFAMLLLSEAPNRIAAAPSGGGS